jgi:hypothetical protein
MGNITKKYGTFVSKFDETGVIEYHHLCEMTENNIF